MPQASIFAFARSYVLDPDGSYFVTRMRPLNGNRTPLPSSQSMSRMSRRCVHGGVPHIDRERDRLSDASM
jgi:hypothetical protein